MVLEGVRIRTNDFSLHADRINGRQLWAALERLTAGSASTGAASASQTAAQAGPAAIRTPAEQYASNVSGASDPSAPQAGFADGAGGDNAMRQLDTQGVLSMLLRFLEQFLQSFMQSILGGGQSAGNAGQQGGPCGGQQGTGGQGGCSGSPAGTAGGSSGTGSTGAGSGASGSSGTGAGSGTGSSAGTPTAGGAGTPPTPTNPPPLPGPSTGGGGSGMGSCHTRPRRRRHCGTESANPFKRLLKSIGKHGATAATGAAAGGLPGLAAAIAKDLGTSHHGSGKHGSRSGGGPRGAHDRPSPHGANRHANRSGVLTPAVGSLNGSVAPADPSAGGVRGPRGYTPSPLPTGPRPSPLPTTANGIPPGARSLFGASGPGGASGGALGGASGGASNASSAPAGASLEDRIFAYFKQQLRDVEGQLETAMQQQGQGGGQGDSQSAGATQVQRLVQKRNESFQTLTDMLKTMHESTMSVARNLK